MSMLFKALCLIVFLSTFFVSGLAADKRDVSMTKETVGLFIQLDPTNVGKPLETTEKIYKQLKAKLLPLGKEPVDFTKAQKDFRTYLREYEGSDRQRNQVTGVILKSKDLKALARIEGTRYVIVVSTGVTSSEEKTNIWTGSRKNMTVLTNVLIYDAETATFLTDDEYESIGKTSGSYDRALSRAIEDVLEKIDFGEYFKPEPIRILR